MTPLALALLRTDGPRNLRLPLLKLLVYGSAQVLAEIFERLGQPGIVGGILAGVLIGPSVLAWVAPNGLLTALSDLGVMFLQFRVGMEVKSSELWKVDGTGFLVAVLGVVVPFFAGWALLGAWGGIANRIDFRGCLDGGDQRGDFGASTRFKRAASQTASQVILAAAVIDDVLGLLVLAVVSGMARGSLKFLDITITLAIATSFVVIIAVWGRHAMNRVVPRVEEKLKGTEAEFAFSICLLFALALLATKAGGAAIVGAFLAGMALGESVGEHVHTLVQGATELLFPFFLVGLGLQINLGVFNDSSVILLPPRLVSI